MGTNKSSKLTQSKNSTLKSAMFYIVPFVILNVYFLVSYFMKGKPEVRGYYLIHFLYTYEHGFVSRGLVGEVISWFANSVSDQLIDNISLYFFAFLILCASLCIGKALNKASKEKETFYPVLILIILICLLPCSFRLYYEDRRLDKLVWAVALLGAFFACNKKTIWLTVPICMLATLINPIFLFTSMILVSIILLQEFQSSGLSKKNGIICLVAYLSMIALGIWAVVSERMLGFENAREMVDYYFSRYTGTRFINYESYEGLWLLDYFATKEEVLRAMIIDYGLAWRGIMDTCITIIFVFGPLFTILGLFWKRAMKKADDKLQKFIFFLCMISPVATLPAIALSWESQKLFGNNMIVQLCLMVYFIVNKNDAVMKTLADVKAFARKNIVLVAAIAVYIIAVMV